MATGINSQEHPLDILKAAHFAAHRVRFAETIPEELKDTWYKKIGSAIDAFFEGVKYEEREDGSWFFESKPHKSRTPEEKKGHHLTIQGREWICDCPGGTYNGLCWARAARRMIEEIHSDTFERTPRSDELFADTEEGAAYDDEADTGD